MARVELYTKAYCGYCARAKSVLRDKGVAFEEYDITLGGQKRTEMLARSNGRTTVPQIFIADQHIGGCDDLIALDRDGTLERLLVNTQ